MSLTKKAVIFLLSFFLTLIVVSLTSQYISPLVINMDQNLIINIVAPLFATIGLFFFIVIQALIRYMFIKRILTTNTNLVSANIGKFNIKERLLFYVFFILIYFVTLLGKMIFDYTFMIRILLFIGSIIIAEMLLRMSNKSTKIFFQRNGILIIGFDVRIEVPFGQNVDVYNNSGFYSYNDLKDYSIFPDRMELSLINDLGKIVFMANGELKRQITGLMVQNKIPVKNISDKSSKNSKKQKIEK